MEKVLTDKEVAEAQWYGDKPGKLPKRGKGVIIGQLNGKTVYKGTDEEIDQELNKKTIEKKREQVPNPGLAAAQAITIANKYK